MMASVTYNVQGSCSTLSSGPSCWSKGNKVKHLALPRAVKNKDRFVSLRCSSCLSVGASPVLGPKSKLFKISAFKGSIRRDDAGGRTNGAKSFENPLKVSYLQHQSEESPVESSEVHNVAAPYTSKDEMTPRSLAIQKLFKSWLMLLRAPPLPQTADEVHEEPSSSGASEEPKSVQTQESLVPLKKVGFYFLGLDAAIKLPLLIFAPLYLAVNLVYGVEVSKEMGPIWILAPVVFAVNIKIFQAVCALYVSTFWRTVKLIKNAPAYYTSVRNHIATMHNRVTQPLENLKRMTYKVAARRLIRDLLGWLGERFLDFVELIWPFYRRTIRTLKRANFI